MTDRKKMLREFAADNLRQARFHRQYAKKYGDSSGWDADRIMWHMRRYAEWKEAIREIN